MGQLLKPHHAECACSHCEETGGGLIAQLAIVAGSRSLAGVSQPVAEWLEKQRALARARGAEDHIDFAIRDLRRGCRSLSRAATMAEGAAAATLVEMERKVEAIVAGAALLRTQLHFPK